MALRRRADGLGGAIWPGFVDAMTAILLVLTFVLSIFMITQYVLRETITGQEEAIDEKERALDTLSGRLDALSDMLALERTEKTRLADEGTALRASLADLGDEKQASDAQIAALIDELGATEDSLEERSAAAESLAAKLTESSAAMQALELRLDERRAEAEETLTLLAAAEAARARLGDELEEREADVTARDALLDVARDELAQLEETSAEEQRQVALLNEQTRALRAQLSALEAKLAVSDTRLENAAEASEAQQAEIATLGERLNAALAERAAALEERRKLLEEQVDELSDFRSDFFGRVRRALGDRDEVRIVGDRFVFQSEVLFAPASAELAEAGEAELAKFANILKDLTAEIPEDLNWILRIDGHTDRRPLRANGSRYRNNWELSQARALSVAEYLIDEHGIAPERLAPTGFGEYQPLDEGTGAAALARNRRIELKLTER